MKKATYPNNKFDYQLWSAPRLYKADDIKQELNRLSLTGRKIKELKFIGLCYDLHTEDIEDYFYNQYENTITDENTLQKMSDFNNIPDDFELPRSALIDELFLIKFNDGDIFEIDTPMDPEYRFSMNQIPWETDFDTNQPNIDANILLSSCLNATIEKVDIACYMNNAIEENSVTAVSQIIINLDNGLSLTIEPMFDYCKVQLWHNKETLSTITLGELKKGFINRS